MNPLYFMGIGKLFLSLLAPKERTIYLFTRSFFSRSILTLPRLSQLLKSILADPGYFRISVNPFLSFLSLFIVYPYLSGLPCRIFSFPFLFLSCPFLSLHFPILFSSLPFPVHIFHSNSLKIRKERNQHGSKTCNQCLSKKKR